MEEADEIRKYRLFSNFAFFTVTILIVFPQFSSYFSTLLAVCSFALSFLIIFLSEKEIASFRNKAIEDKEQISKNKENEWQSKYQSSLDESLKKDALILEQLDKINALHAKSEQLRTKIETIHEEKSREKHALESLETKIAHYEKELATKNSSISSYLNTIKTCQLDSEKTHAEKLTLKNEVTQLSEKLKLIAEKLSNLEILSHDLQQKVHAERHHWQEQLTVVQNEKIELLSKINALTISFEQVSEEARNAERIQRRYSGLYTQLKDQFLEKSILLDQTRKALFVAHEEIETISRKHIETSEHHDIDRYIVKLEKEFNVVSKDYQKEIDGLHDLIAVLSTRV